MAVAVTIVRWLAQSRHRGLESRWPVSQTSADGTTDRAPLLVLVALFARVTVPETVNGNCHRHNPCLPRSSQDPCPELTRVGPPHAVGRLGARKVGRIQVKLWPATAPSDRR